MIENIKNNLENEIENLEKRIDSYWEDRNIPVTKRGQIINKLNKQRITLSNWLFGLRHFPETTLPRYLSQHAI